jgi:hypothetical protein
MYVRTHELMQVCTCASLTFTPFYQVSNKQQKHFDESNYRLHGSAAQYYGRLRFPTGTCDFWTSDPP